MAEQRESLIASEQSNILEAVYDLLAEYPNINLCFEDNDVDKTSVGLYSSDGAVYLSKNILGGFKGLVPFMVTYQSRPTKDTKKLAMVKYMNDLSDWLVTQSYPALSDNREILKIEQMEVPCIVRKGDNGAITYGMLFELTYRKE